MMNLYTLSWKDKHGEVYLILRTRVLNQLLCFSYKLFIDYVPFSKFKFDVYHLFVVP